MRLVFLRGITVAALFGVVLFVMIPVYVPRPAFIPGFAPPPDMWPRTIAIAGIVLGLIAASQAFLRRGAEMVDPDEEQVWQQTASTPVLLGRFALAILVLVGFVFIMPSVGFVTSGILLMACTIALTGERQKWLWGLVISIALPTGLFLFFSKALGTQFPIGQFIKTLGL